MDPRTPHIQFRPGTLAGALSIRGDNQNEIARRDLDRYYESIETTLREIQLSRDEWLFLRDIMQGTYIDTGQADWLWNEIIDADDDIAGQYGINLNNLAGRIRSMPMFARVAICDAIERHWRT